MVMISESRVSNRQFNSIVLGGEVGEESEIGVLLIVDIDIVEATPLPLVKMGQIVGSETVIVSVVHGHLALCFRVVSESLSFGVGVGSNWSGWSESRFRLIWINNIVFVVHSTGQKVEEIFLVITSSLTFGDIFSHSSLLVLRDLCHLEEHVEKTESDDNENNQAVHNFEGKISLGLQIVLLIESLQLIFLGLNFLDLLFEFWNWVRDECIDIDVFFSSMNL